MLTPAETDQLRAATLFSVPVPRAVLAAAGAAASVAEPEQAVDRLQGLGLVDLYAGPGEDDAAASPLARPLVPALTEAETAHLANGVILPLYASWKDEEGRLPADLRGLETARLALLGKAPAEVLNASARAGAFFLFDRAHNAQGALDLVIAVLATLDRAEATPSPHILRLGANSAERLGKVDVQEKLLERGSQIRDADPQARAMLLSARASRFTQTGEMDKAERLLQEAAAIFASLDDVRERAVVLGKIADILETRGQLDEALKIRTEEQLPVYKQLGDERSRAVTMGQIADILQARGQIDEALKIRTEEQLPVYEQLRDVRSRAITMGKIADILQARGQLDEALRIRTEELPVYDRFCEVRSRALTMGRIADILQAKGQLDEALQIRNEEELPVYDRLGEVRERAVTMGKIADILQARGQLDEALKIRTKEELPVYDRLGEVRERTVTMGKIAAILLTRGQFEEALNIHTEALPVYERLGDVRSRAFTMGRIADILQARSQLDEALKIRTEEELPVYERLGEVRERAVTMGRIADILQAKGQLDAAMAMQLDRSPIADEMGDAEIIAHIKFSCAGIRLQRGGWAKGEAQTILNELSESFTIARKLGLTDFIGGVAILYGQALAGMGRLDEGLAVLEEAAGALETLKRGEEVKRVRALQDRIRAKQTGAG
jgi:tetratricopeptide (TPR) repeat protein